MDPTGRSCSPGLVFWEAFIEGYDEFIEDYDEEEEPVSTSPEEEGLSSSSMGNEGSILTCQLEWGPSTQTRPRILDLRPPSEKPDPRQALEGVRLFVEGQGCSIGTMGGWLGVCCAAGDLMSTEEGRGLLVLPLDETGQTVISTLLSTRPAWLPRLRPEQQALLATAIATLSTNPCGQPLAASLHEFLRPTLDWAALQAEGLVTKQQMEWITQNRVIQEQEIDRALRERQLRHRN